jgi:hypothetical protein
VSVRAAVPSRGRESAVLTAAEPRETSMSIPLRARGPYSGCRNGRSNSVSLPLQPRSVTHVPGHEHHGAHGRTFRTLSLPFAHVTRIARRPGEKSGLDLLRRRQEENELLFPDGDGGCAFPSRNGDPGEPHAAVAGQERHPRLVHQCTRRSGTCAAASRR